MNPEIKLGAIGCIDLGKDWHLKPDIYSFHDTPRWGRVRQDVMHRIRQHEMMRVTDYDGNRPEAPYLVTLDNGSTVWLPEELLEIWTLTVASDLQVGETVQRSLVGGPVLMLSGRDTVDRIVPAAEGRIGIWWVRPTWAPNDYGPLDPVIVTNRVKTREVAR